MYLGQKLLRILNKIKSNKKIIGYGATAKVATILNYCNINKDLISYLLTQHQKRLITLFQVKI